MTGFSPAAAPGASATRCWAWPIDETCYDRKIALSEPEVETLRGLDGDLLAQARGADPGLDGTATWSPSGGLPGRCVMPRPRCTGTTRPPGEADTRGMRLGWC